MDTGIDNKVFVFDLDDTLYKEIDFLKSGYKKIAMIVNKNNYNHLYNQMLSWYRSGINVFDKLMINYNVSKEFLLDIYRAHVPEIKLENDVFKLLNQLRKNRVIIGLITDGRSITQRNKLKALEIEDLFDDIIISEEFGSSKTDERNFLFFHKKYPAKEYIYIGDNPQKDFIVPNKLHWMTYCLLDDGRNIHPQNFSIDKHLLPKEIIKELNELLNIT